MDRQLWSIGYEQASWAQVREALHAAGVKRVIDVRDLPLSRRPGFSKRQLTAGLEEAGIAYTHLRGLGTPPEGRAAHRAREYARFWQIVDARLGTTEAVLDLARAADLALAAPVCLLCYEADPALCHRCRVGEILAARHGFCVHHLRVARDLPSPHAIV